MDRTAGLESALEQHDLSDLHARVAFNLWDSRERASLEVRERDMWPVPPCVARHAGLRERIGNRRVEPKQPAARIPDRRGDRMRTPG